MTRALTVEGVNWTNGGTGEPSATKPVRAAQTPAGGRQWRRLGGGNDPAGFGGAGRSAPIWTVIGAPGATRRRSGAILATVGEGEEGDDAETERRGGKSSWRR